MSDTKALPNIGRPLLKRRASSLAKRRVRQPWPTGRPFKILSLDGGGVRGIFSATLLECMEKQYCQEAALVDHFDMIAGTSTGGIIAIGLSQGKTAQQMQRLYAERATEIFPSGFLRTVKQWFFSKYHFRQLERILKEELGTEKFGSSSKRLVVPSFLGPKADIAVLKTDHHADFKCDWNMEAWQVARATSAAPTFFDGLRVEDSFFIDGGVWANNPIMCAVVDAMSAYEIELDQIKILSIGTGNAAPKIGWWSSRGGYISWAKIIKSAMYLTTDNALAQATLLLGPDSIVRLEPSEDTAQIEMDDVSRAIRELPAEASAMFANKSHRLDWFFEQQVSERERHYT